MKTLKLALVATVVAFAMVTVTYADDFQSKVKPTKVIILSLDKVMSVPGLAGAILIQVNPADFLGGTQLVYVAQVNYNGAIYRISGTLMQWLNFFKLKDKPPVINDQEVVWGIG
jgi:hypothetical protein